MNSRSICLDASSEIVPDYYEEGALSPVPESTPHAVETDPALAYLASLAPTGRRTMKMRLDQVALLLAGRKNLHVIHWERLRYEHVAAIRSLLHERGLAPASINATLYAVRGVAKAAWNLSLMSAEDYARIRNVKPARGTRLPAGRSVASGELAALLEACMKDDSPAGTRDAALVGVLYCGGLRRAETVALNVEDYDPATGALKVPGKGDKERLVYIMGGASEALRDWLAWRGAASLAVRLEAQSDNTPEESTPALPQSAPLFCPIRKNGLIQPRRMTDQAIYLILQKRAMQAGVLRCSPHDLRRTFVGDLLDREVDIVTVQQLAGHASVSTTARYDRRGERAKQKAANALHLPYRKKER
jgi:site-specific recombinase XerD